MQTNAAQASHPGRIVRESPALPSAAEAAERRFWPDSAHEGCCALPVQAANVILRNHDSENQLFAESSSHNLRSASSPTLLTEQVGRRRPQRPGNQHALARVFRCPPVIHPRELPATADSAAIVQQTRKFTFSLDTLCDRTFRAATQKHESLVQKLWTGKLPCGKPRKTKNELSRTAARVRGRAGSSLFSLLLTWLGTRGGANAAIPGTATRCSPPAGEHIANPHHRFGDVATQILPTSHTQDHAHREKDEGHRETASHPASVRLDFSLANERQGDFRRVGTGERKGKSAEDRSGLKPADAARQTRGGTGRCLSILTLLSPGRPSSEWRNARSFDSASAILIR